MPLRFYRRFRTGPFRMNVSKRGVSYSVGGRGAWLTLGRGRVRTSVGIPGTGVYLYQQRRLPRPTSTPASAPVLPPPTKLQWLAIAGIIVVRVRSLRWATPSNDPIEHPRPPSLQVT
jgi:hypothetical protein